MEAVSVVGQFLQQVDQLQTTYKDEVDVDIESLAIETLAVQELVNSISQLISGNFDANELLAIERSLIESRNEEQDEFEYSDDFLPQLRAFNFENHLIEERIFEAFLRAYSEDPFSKLQEEVKKRGEYRFVERVRKLFPEMKMKEVKDSISILLQWKSFKWIIAYAAITETQGAQDAGLVSHLMRLFNASKENAQFALQCAQELNLSAQQWEDFVKQSFHIVITNFRNRYFEILEQFANESDYAQFQQADDIVEREGEIQMQEEEEKQTKSELFNYGMQPSQQESQIVQEEEQTDLLNDEDIQFALKEDLDMEDYYEISDIQLSERDLIDSEMNEQNNRDELQQNR